MYEDCGYGYGYAIFGDDGNHSPSRVISMILDVFCLQSSHQQSQSYLFYHEGRPGRIYKYAVRVTHVSRTHPHKQDICFAFAAVQ
jgi:hypothetical protein